MLFCQKAQILLKLQGLVLLQFIVKVILLPELFLQIIHQLPVPVLTAQLMVSARGDGTDHFLSVLLLDADNSHVEGSTPQVIHYNSFIHAPLVQSIADGCGSRLVDDGQNVQACQFPGGFRSRSLRRSEVGGACNYYIFDLFVQMAAGIPCHFLQDQGGNLRRGIAHSVILDGKVRISHKALYQGDGGLGLQYRIFLGRLAHYHIFGTFKINHGRSYIASFQIGYYLCISHIVDICHTGVCCAQIDS